MTTDEQHVQALAGMLAAVEYARIQHTGMEQKHQAGDPAGAGRAQVLSAASLYAVEEDCKRGDLDLLGSLAGVTLRAATLACQASTVAGQPMTVPEFLDELEAELTPPGDTRGMV
jgi:hypothetical protein